MQGVKVWARCLWAEVVRTCESEIRVGLIERLVRFSRVDAVEVT